MSRGQTVPQRAMVLPVRALRVEVQGGPDAGRSALASGETLSVGSAAGNDLVLRDPTVSRFHVELTSHPRGVLVVDHGSTNGTFAGAVRLERGYVPAGTMLAVGDTVLRVGDGETVALPLHGGDDLCGLRGRTPAMRALMAQISRVARTEAPVLIIGESGTGKEVIARALHELGSRRSRLFVTVDCGTLAPTLVASELFGHERGAFTGAERQHIGAFERAHGGTLFLDEVGELSPEVQPALLGVLERHRFRRVGGRGDVGVDVRVICATNRDLRAEVNSGGFRLDLYYRTAVVRLSVPPLRERAEDIPLLVEQFARECGHAGSVEELFPPEWLAALQAHHWPGNVRELRNWVEAAVAMGETPELERLIHRSESVRGGDPFAAMMAPLSSLSYKHARSTLLTEFEARYLTQLLQRTQGNVSRAAREAQIDRSHLVDLLRRHQVRGR